jgi:hypothetical protein
LGGFLHFEAIRRRAPMGSLQAAAEKTRIPRHGTPLFPVISFQKSMVFALRGVAPGRRFWHGPADLRPPFWAGKASFLCACRVRGDGVGLDQDLRQIQ